MVRVSALLMALCTGLYAQNQSKSVPDVSGEWQGKISTLRLVVNIDKAADGALSGKLTSLDQGNVTIPIDTVTFQNESSTLRLELKQIGAVYEGKLGQDDTEMNGTWQQG